MSDIPPVQQPDPADFIPEYVREAYEEARKSMPPPIAREDDLQKIMAWLIYGDAYAEEPPEDSPAQRYDDFMVWLGKPTYRKWYVNSYEVHEHYGGPEEGGWWYKVHTPRPGPNSLGPFPGDDQGYSTACYVAKILNDQREDPSHEYTEVQRHPARVSPAHRPHYC